jgi:predicted secreted protein
MNVIGYSITFFVSWWIILFMVLPLGVKTHSESDETIDKGVEVGSPIHANIKQKMKLNTIITICFVMVIGVIDYFNLITIM